MSLGVREASQAESTKANLGTQSLCSEGEPEKSTERKHDTESRYMNKDLSKKNCPGDANIVPNLDIE